MPLAIVTLIAVAFLPNTDLGTQNAIQRAKAEVEDAEDAAIDAAAASVALSPVGLAHAAGQAEAEHVGTSRDTAARDE